MKTQIALKTALDIAFFGSVIAIIGSLLVFPSGILIIPEEIKTGPLSKTLFYSLYGTAILAPVLFAIGLHFLRTLVKCYTKPKKEQANIPLLLNKSGNFILASSVALIAESLLSFFFQATYQNIVEISINSGAITTLFLLSIGLFFKIQSNVLQAAIIAQNENELTI